MNALPEPDQITQVKVKIINQGLALGLVLGLMAYLSSLPDFYQSSFKFHYFTDFLILCVYAIVLVYRRKISLKVKAFIILVSLFFLIFLGLYGFGVYADGKIFMIVIPFWAVLGFSLRQTFVIYLVAVLMFATFGILYVLGILKTHAHFDRDIQAPSAWLINILLLSIVAFILLNLTIKFNQAFLALIRDLKNKNAELNEYKNILEKKVEERTRDLESANEELKANNEELLEKSLIINEQNLELRTTLEQLQETQAQLIEAEKMASLGILTAGIAHEINNPLNYIKNGIEVIEAYLREQKLGEHLDEIGPFVEAVKTGAKRASNIVKSLGKYSRNDDLPRSDCSVHQVLEDCLTLLHNQYKNRIEIIRQYASEEPIIDVNEGKIHQVFLNILTNAIQAIESRGNIGIQTEILESVVQISISDTGSGISEENLKRIFDPFFTTKAPGKGVGLGLSITQKIILEYQGNITCFSEISKGTQVVIQLPLKNNGSKT